MKLCSSKNPEARGIMLMECLVYMGVLALIFGFGYGAYFRAFDATKGLQRNANDITVALNAGEQWRGDIRRAQAIVFTNNVLRITQPKGRVEYALAEGSVWRTSSGHPKIRVLTNVKESTMLSDKRQDVTAWRWELELKTRKAEAPLKPLFTFEATPRSTP